MHPAIGVLLLLLPYALGRPAAAQPADCSTDAGPGDAIPLALDLAGRRGVSKDIGGQVYVAVPATPGMACRAPREPPRDVLHGAPGGPQRGALAVVRPRDSDGAPCRGVRSAAGGQPPRPPEDVLRGQAGGDALRGPPASDLLRGAAPPPAPPPGTPHVSVEQLPEQP
jgi:hypothetical protein